MTVSNRPMFLPLATLANYRISWAEVDQARNLASDASGICAVSDTEDAILQGYCLAIPKSTKILQ